jgi:two-component system probable response regulator PhcQ
MEGFYDYKKFAILYVDDEVLSLKNFDRAFGGRFRILTASSAQDGLKLLEEHRDSIGVLMTDQRMPGEKGVWLLEKARALRPHIIRILVTAYSDMDAAIPRTLRMLVTAYSDLTAAVDAINTGAIYKYITKPWDPPQLENTLQRALEFFMVQRERDQLLKEKMSVLHNMMIADRIVSLGLLAAGLSHHIRNALVAVKTILDLAPVKIQFTDRIRIHEVVNETVTGLKNDFAAKNIQVENKVPDSLPPLQVDKPKFQRLFELLLKDELVSLPPGSRITLSARAVNETNRNEIHVQVQDNGPGLPKDALRLVFDPFALRTDSPMEYGINLMACYFIVHHHGGKIEAQSEAGRGTTFNLKLPVNPNRITVNIEGQEFLQKMILNDNLWEKLISST